MIRKSSPWGSVQRGILWDMDGVIADTASLHFRSWSETLSRYGFFLTPHIFNKYFGKNNASMIRSLFPSADDTLVHAIETEKENIFLEGIPAHTRLFEGVTDWLERFSSWGFPQAVASSAPQANINVLVEEYHIAGYFQALVSGQSLPSKPDPSVFLSAASRIGIAPPGGVVIEDSVYGIEGAARAGMKSIGVATSHPVEELEQATLVVHRLTDLNEALFSKYLIIEFPEK